MLAALSSRVCLFVGAFFLLAVQSPVQAQDLNLSEGDFFEGEPYLAVNPTDPQHVVVAWMGFVFNSGSALTIKVSSSFDGGLSWSAPVAMPHIAPDYKSADPCLVFDAQGKLYLGYIDYKENPYAGGVYLFTSTDGGLTWSDATEMINVNDDPGETPIDRPWLAVDPVGQYLYLTTMTPKDEPAPNRSYVSISTDGGQSFNWRYLDDTLNYSAGEIMQPMATPTTWGSTLLAVYPSFVTTPFPIARYVLARSTDAGQNFSYQEVFAIQQGQAAQNDSAKLAYKLLHNPADTNHLAFLYFANLHGDIDLFLRESFNQGGTWSAPLRINDDPTGNGVLQDMVWADFSADGDLLISWRDRRESGGSGYQQPIGFYAAFRDKDSSAFAPNFSLSDTLVAYDPILESAGNDFMGLALRNDTLYAAWGNTIDGSLDIWFLKMSAVTGTITHRGRITSPAAALEVFPNPATHRLRLRNPEGRPIAAIALLNSQGQQVLPRRQFNTAEAELSLAGLPAGTYFVVAWVEGQQVLHRVIKE